MGYCASIEMDIKLKKDVDIKSIKSHLKHNVDFAWDAISYIDPQFKEIEDGSIVLSGTYDDKYYEDDWYKFLDYIAPIVQDNELIECIGEDYQMWGFRFNKGTWKEVQGHIVYD